MRAFGEKVFDIIEATPDRLREVDGIGPVRAANILAAWAEQKAVREIMVFLHSHGVDRLRLRGLSGAKDEVLLTATAQNLRRLAKLLCRAPQHRLVAWRSATSLHPRQQPFI